ncbi:hypothetical protein [Streptomyces sp. NPDC017991]|uniref:hypothetical protein n=1 Tax=Streptomyces sp. NPDC017991 TaxID=3365026 RepID=UPI0037946839
MPRTTLVRAALATTAALLLGTCSATAEPTAATGPVPGPPAAVAPAPVTRSVEAVREPLRRSLRRQFLGTHAREVRELRAALVPALRDAERTYGVRLVFPTP